MHYAFFLKLPNGVSSGTNLMVFTKTEPKKKLNDDQALAPPAVCG